MRDNLMDLAIAVVIGAAFGKIVTAGVLPGGINIAEKHSKSETL